MVGVIDVELHIHHVGPRQGDRVDLADLETLQLDRHADAQALCGREGAPIVVVLGEPPLVDAHENQDGGDRQDAQEHERPDDLLGEANAELHFL
jgi:hypothetical protein